VALESDLALVIAVVKIGASSITSASHVIDRSAVARLCAEVAEVRRQGHYVVVVSSGAVEAGLATLRIDHPADPPTLQAVAAVGQSRLMRLYDEVMDHYGVVGCQLLMTRSVLGSRRQYLQARHSVLRLLKLGVVPFVNENDGIADEEVRLGDNTRLAALVAQMLGATTLVVLSDTAGLFTADPNVDDDARLIEEIVEVEQLAPVVAGGLGEPGLEAIAPKLAAAMIAAWSGVRVVFASANRSGVLSGALGAEPGVSTVVRPRDRPLPLRKGWIAFAAPTCGTLVVDHGARSAITDRGASLLLAGVVEARGLFEAGAPVEIADPEGRVFAKGLVRLSASRIRERAGIAPPTLPGDSSQQIVHRDDLAVLT
jgi:glutamate 5-kinase